MIRVLGQAIDLSMLARGNREMREGKEPSAPPQGDQFALDPVERRAGHAVAAFDLAHPGDRLGDGCGTKL